MNILKGFEKSDNGRERFIPVLKRTEKIPGIIRGDKRYNLLLSDPAQRAEPFDSYFGSLKKIGSLPSLS